MAEHEGDKVPFEDAMTRSQVLTMRGYPPEVIAGNGHSGKSSQRATISDRLGVDTGNGARESHAVTLADLEVVGCAVCAGPIPEERVRRRAATCSESCAAEHLRARRAVNEKARKARTPVAVGNHRAEPVAASQAATGVPERSLLEVLQSAAAALPERWFAEVEHGRAVLSFTVR